MPSRLGGAKTDPQARENGAEQVTLDCLLKFNFFLSGEVQENLSLFGSVKHKQKGLAGSGDYQTQLRSSCG
jgi:hypothetical protein